MNCRLLNIKLCGYCNNPYPRGKCVINTWRYSFSEMEVYFGTKRVKEYLMDKIHLKYEYNLYMIQGLKLHSAELYDWYCKIMVLL